MSHTHKNQKPLLVRIRRIKGQLEAVEKMLEEENECYQTLQAIAACRGAINGLFVEVLSDHIKYHIIEEATLNQKTVRNAGEEVISVLKSFIK